jgi:hypothetical protein
MPITKNVFMKKLPLTICKALKSVDRRKTVTSHEETGLFDTHLADSSLE